MAEGVAQAIEHLLSMCKALGPISNTAQKQEVSPNPGSPSVPFNLTWFILLLMLMNPRSLTQPNLHFTESSCSINQGYNLTMCLL
jgi:hypothetical protein